MAVFIAESIIFIVLFAALVVTIAKNTDPISWIYNYPQPIIDRCYELGKIPANKNVRGPKVYIKKGIACLLIGVLLGLVVRFINHAEGFWQGFLIAYALWLVVDWFDVILDITWFCHDRSLVIPGTEDLTDAYHDYLFHVKASAKGMLLGIVMAAAAGIVTAF